MLKTILNYPIFCFASIRNFLFKRKILKQVKSKFPIVSVGNISFGGTGKTPLIILIAQRLIDLGFKPLLLSRGYKRKSKENILLLNENSDTGWEKVGDENYLIFEKLKIPIVVSKKKYKAIDFIEKKINGINLIIVDDGFQHLKLHRDLDIVLVSKDTPYKLLREPLKSVQRAQIVLIEEGFENSLLPSGNFEVFIYKKTLRCFKDINSNEIPLQMILNEKVALVSGIGNNKSFFDTLKPILPYIIKHFEFPDHYFYKQRDLEKIIDFLKKQSTNVLITTEKDLIKLAQFRELFNKSQVTVISSVVEIEILNEEKLIQKIIGIIKQE